MAAPAESVCFKKCCTCASRFTTFKYKPENSYFIMISKY